MKYTEIKDSKRIALTDIKFLPHNLSYDMDNIKITLHEILSEMNYVKFGEYNYRLGDKINIVFGAFHNSIFLSIDNKKNNYYISVLFQENGINNITIDKDTHLNSKSRILSKKITSDSMFIDAILEYTRKLWDMK